MLGVVLASCAVESGDVDDNDDSGSTPRKCANDNGSIELPPGFCATVFADNLGEARHIAVSPDGVVFVAIANAGDESDGTTQAVVALVDTDDDGIADDRASFGRAGGNGIAWYEDHLYLAQDDAIVRWKLGAGELTPNGDEEVVVSGFVDDGDHVNKSIAFGEDALYVNVGSASNACQEENREPGSPGIDPCPELEVRAGIWRFDIEMNKGELASGLDFEDGERHATGVRNAVALTVDPSTDGVVAVVNGRDQLHDNWPEIYSEEDDTRLPTDDLLVVKEGADYGWPYCYHDGDLERLVLAPEYGGGGSLGSRCDDATAPDTWYPAHSAPLSIHFYRGDMFPGRYRGGAFVAFHGNRFDQDATGELHGYSVGFAPFENGEPTREHETFADDFAGDARPLPDEAEYRPVGIAEMKDGSLLISDDQAGRIWRVYYDLARTP